MEIPISLQPYVKANKMIYLDAENPSVSYFETKLQRNEMTIDYSPFISNVFMKYYTCFAPIETTDLSTNVKNAKISDDVLFIWQFENDKNEYNDILIK